MFSTLVIGYPFNYFLTKYIQSCLLQNCRMRETLMINSLFMYFTFLVALQALKRKKRYEKQLQQIDGTLSTIEFQRECLENASTNTEVLKAMGSAAKALKLAHNNM